MTDLAAVPPIDDDYPDARLAPPNDLLAEKSVLGSMMLSPTAISDASDILTAGDFYRPAHETVYAAIMRLFGRGEAVDAVTVGEELTRAGEIRRVGGHAFVHELVQAVPMSGNAAYYAKIVHDKSVMRRLADAGSRIVAMVADGSGNVEDLVNAAQSEVFAVGTGAKSQDYVSMGEIYEPTLDEIEAAASHGEALTGVASGYTDLDAVTNGFQPGQLIIIAARPALGKSTAALDIVRECAFRQKKAAIMFSLEMSRTEIGMRAISAEAQIPLQILRKGLLTDKDWGKVAALVGDFTDAPLFVDDTPGITIAQIRTKCRRLKASHNLSLVVVDYLQLLTSGGKVESRQAEVSEFSRALKLLAKELDVPVIAVAQLNRGPEQRVNKKPVLSDLRESGSLEQDADMVMLIHRPDVGDPDSARLGEADFLLVKHRNGPTAEIPVAFQGHLSRFVNMAGYEA